MKKCINKVKTSLKLNILSATSFLFLLYVSFLCKIYYYQVRLGSLMQFSSVTLFDLRTNNVGCIMSSLLEAATPTRKSSGSGLAENSQYFGASGQVVLVKKSPPPKKIPSLRAVIVYFYLLLNLLTCSRSSSAVQENSTQDENLPIQKYNDVNDSVALTLMYAATSDAASAS